MRTIINEIPSRPVPHLPQAPRPQMQPPTVIVYEKQAWEYKVVSRRADGESPLAEVEATLQDLRDEFEGFDERARVLSIRVMRGDWPAQRSIAGLDLPREKIIETLKAFAAEVDRADWAVVYYAGHGIEFGGANFLIPTDARHYAPEIDQCERQ